MAGWSKLCGMGSRFCLACVGRLLLWTLWLALCLLLGLGAWIAFSPSIDLPAPLLRRIEARLSQDTVAVSIGKITLTTSGELVARDISTRVAGFDDPVARVESLSTRVDLWALLSGRQGAHRISLSGGELIIPAQLSPNGAPLALLRDVDADLDYGNHLLRISRLGGRCAGVSLRITGALDDTALRRRKGKPVQPGPALIAFFRSASIAYPRIQALGKGWIDADLLPSSDQAASVRIAAGLDAWLSERPHSVELRDITLALSPFDLVSASPWEATADLSVARITSPLGSIEHLDARLSALINPRASSALLAFTPHTLDLCAGRVSTKWIPAEGISARITPSGGGNLDLGALLRRRPAPEADSQAGPAPDVALDADLAASVCGNDIGATATGHFPELSATVKTRAEIDSRLIAAISAIIGRDLLKFCSVRRKGFFQGSATLRPGGKLALAEGWVSAEALDLYTVPVEAISGRITFDGTEFLGSHALLRVGDNLARGSYWMNARTKQFRFLLDGRLRPTHLNPWFSGWWPQFWSDFNFPEAPPNASIDIAGRWGSVNQTRVFVAANARNSAWRGVSVEQASTRLFIRPNFTHAIDISVRRPEGLARGSFTRSYDYNRGLWTRLDFEGEGVSDPQQTARLISPAAATLASNFIWQNAPSGKVRGWFNGPGAPGGPAHHIDFDVASVGDFTLFRFPLKDVSFSGTWEGPHLELPVLHATAAGGRVSGKARVETEGENRGLIFKGSVESARMGEGLNQLEAHIAELQGTRFIADPTRLPDTWITLNMEATGRYDDVYSFKGKGDAHIWGGELANIRLMGGLSKLLSFTSLRFTHAKSRFEIDHTKVTFPSFRLAGANSAIDAFGTYQLDSHSLDFRAKVWPFDQKNSLIQSALGLMLAPLSHAFEVKLTGKPSEPNWVFINNPFRSLAQPQETDTPVLQATETDETGK